MPVVTILPDNRAILAREGETLLETSLNAGIPHASACGGQAQCSTCRVWILEGLENCRERTERERDLAGRLGFGSEVRLACQTTISGDVRLRRLVLDDTDLAITSQLSRSEPGIVGQTKTVAVLFSDLRAFTRLTKVLSPYDVVYVLNRYFNQVGNAIDANGGQVVDFYGDGVMALFGLDGDRSAPLHCVKAGLDILHAIDRFQPYMESMYGEPIEGGIGMHYGSAVVGTIGYAGHQKLTAVGDTVNIASRIEGATKESGFRMLVSDSLFEAVKNEVTAGDFIRVTLRGTNERRSLFQITGFTEEGLARLGERNHGVDFRHRRFDGQDWIRVLPSVELPVGEQRVVPLPDRDLLLVRTTKRVHAFDNACPHFRLPLLNSHVTEDEALVCRWHESTFDLNTGEIIRWCPGVADRDGAGSNEVLASAGRSRVPLQPFPVRERDGHIWVAPQSTQPLTLEHFVRPKDLKE